jgi:hypothetical protein
MSRGAMAASCLLHRHERETRCPKSTVDVPMTDNDDDDEQEHEQEHEERIPLWDAL